MDTKKVRVDIKKTTWEELWVILARMSREDWFYDVGWRALGRHFFSEFYTDDVWKWDFSKLQNVCQDDEWPHANENLSEENFVRAVFKAFFWLERLPRETKYELLCKVQKLIRDLSKRINVYKEQATALENKHRRTATEEYDLRLTRHYIKKAREALRRTYQYVADELDGEALLLSQRGFPWMSSLRKIDFVEHLAVDADKANCNDIINKFLDRPVVQVERLVRLYNEDPVAFYEWSKSELGNEIIPMMLNLVNANHLLNARKEMLNEGVSLFKQGKYQVASSVLALQIEGLIRDTLVSCGEDEVSLRATTLTEKAERLANLNVGFYSYEYYAFRFPVLRNEIAHGNAHNTQSNEAIKIMLDLCGLCRYIAKSDLLPCNKMIELAKSAAAVAATERDRISYARFVISNEKILIPAFYGLQSATSSIKKGIQGKSFWEELLKYEVAENRSIKEAIAEGDKIAKRFDARSQFEEFKKECLQKLVEV